MITQVGELAEALGTDGAAVGPLSRVDEGVAPQVSRRGE